MSIFPDGRGPDGGGTGVTQNVTDICDPPAGVKRHNLFQSAPLQVVLLVLDGHRRSPQVNRDEPAGAGYCVAGFDQIDADLLRELSPDVILTPLVSRGFDCLDLAKRLGALGYCGAFRAVSTAVPDPDLIRREIRALCPQLRFDLVFIDA